MGYSAPAIDQKSDLTADFRRDLGDRLGKFRRDDESRRGFPSVEVIQAANLICLQSACLSVNLDEIDPRY